MRGGTETEDIHTPRQENAHIDTLWGQKGAGTLEVWARVYSGAELSEIFSLSEEYILKCVPRFVDSILSVHSVTSLNICS